MGAHSRNNVGCSRQQKGGVDDAYAQRHRLPKETTQYEGDAATTTTSSSMSAESCASCMVVGAQCLGCSPQVRFLAGAITPAFHASDTAREIPVRPLANEKPKLRGTGGIPRTNTTHNDTVCVR